jgi:hypothetical protein
VFNAGNRPKLVRMSDVNEEERIEFSRPVIRTDSLIADVGWRSSVALAELPMK